MAIDIKRFLQLVHHKAVRVVTPLTKTEEHRRAEVKGGAVAPESPTGTTRLNVTLKNQHRKPAFGEQPGCCKP
ncbi:MAG: hypothetical protein BWY63_03037 [Chloroflexi bacterium ADurb.Bin360]|nr:MAG: hypothetical protein BWY63_03037 [Chloroflexi bacterium ADurb.Bin360]